MSNVYNFSTLDEYIYKKAVRRYQLLILSSECFFLVISGEVYEYISCMAKSSTNTLFFRSNTSNKYYSVESQKDGTGYKLNPQTFSRLEKPPQKTNGVAIVTGHSNFAHFLWNQLPALIKVNKGVPVCQEVETLIDVQKIGFKTIQKKNLNKYNSIYIGSQFIDRETIKLVKEMLIDNQLSIWHKNEGKKIIYLGVRGDGKRALLQEAQFYESIIKNINLRFKDRVMFLLDGFSFQNNNLGSGKAQKRSEEVSKVIDKVIQECGCDNAFSINSLPLKEFIKIAECFDFYITHEGTMQHKIGWFHPDKIGILLTGSSHPGTVANWHQNQVEANHNNLTVLGRENFVQYNGANQMRNNSFGIIDLAKTVKEVELIIEKKVFL